MAMEALVCDLSAAPGLRAFAWAKLLKALGGLYFWKLLPRGFGVCLIAQRRLGLDENSLASFVCLHTLTEGSYWTEHSERTWLTSSAALLHVPKGSRDFL
eukprot:459630-Amphidinium_carterae.1